MSQEFPGDSFFIQRAFRNRRLIVYGAGESFHYFKEVVMRQFGYIPSVILDRKFSVGDTFEGIPACSLSDYNPDEDEKRDALVVVCLGNQYYFEEVVNSLRLRGFLNVITLLDIYEIHNPFSLPCELAIEGFQFYLGNRERIQSCLGMLADDLSKEVYVKCLQTHLTRKPVPLPASPRHEQYVPPDIQLAHGHKRFVYCGVSIGEMKSVFSRIEGVEELVCFEPDPNQFRLTADYLEGHHAELAARVLALPCAVYSHEGIEPFTYSETSFGSRILASGSSWTQAVTIDRILPGFGPTIITMDIEGAELEALKGAEKTIRRYRPDLAVCLYHSPSHLWEIPLYLDSLGVGYKFYIRNYTSFVSETVLYATCLL